MKILWLLLVVSLANFGSDELHSQIEGQFLRLADKQDFDCALNNLITEDFLEDPSKDLKIVFMLKIDSLGEIHSAHVRWEVNLKDDKMYSICYELESKYRAKFIHDEFKVDFVGEKYVFCRYPFFYTNLGE